MARGNRKQLLKVPCLCEVPNEETGKLEHGYPAVNCAFGCDVCGWNPEEKERRLRTGKWRAVIEYRSPYSGETVALKPGTRQLHFEKAYERR